jgi:hypothetical protein
LPERNGHGYQSVHLCEYQLMHRDSEADNMQGPTSLAAYTQTCAGAAANVAAQTVNGGVLRNAGNTNAGNSTAGTGNGNAGNTNAGQSPAQGATGGRGLLPLPLFPLPLFPLFPLPIIKHRSPGAFGGLAARAKAMVKRDPATGPTKGQPAAAAPVAAAPATKASANAAPAAPAATAAAVTAARKQTLLAELFTVLLELFDPALPIALAPTSTGALNPIASLLPAITNGTSPAAVNTGNSTAAAPKAPKAPKGKGAGKGTGTTKSTPAAKAPSKIFI